ncbi:50S ribosomal protein L23 [Candidatus Parcubacteria bacterium]|nr:50S ribosomal protein L23 [Candidatus Parcubacteria bacterium]
MAFQLFKKDKKEVKKPAKKEAAQVHVQKEEIAIVSAVGSVLKSFYVSEKSARLMDINQYTFRVAKSANKNEVRKQVEKMYDVHVERVAILNMPKKARNVGKNAGFKSGFKKAIVTLREGDSIAAARP